MNTLQALIIFRKLTFALVLLFYLPFSISQTRSDFSNPTHITHHQGLPDNRVLCLAQDGDGFMWFGTYEGLCRFDGSVTEVFKHDPADANSISNNYINSLFYDKETNCLWIGTRNGLNKLDLKWGRIKNYCHHPGDPCSIADNDIGKSIFKDRQGIIWIATGGKGFMRYDPVADNFDTYSYPINMTDVGERLERINLVNQIAQDLRNDTILWVGTSSGLLRFNKANGKFKRFYANWSDKQIRIRANDIYRMFLHPDGRVYTGTWGNFLMVFDPATASFQKIPATLHLRRFPEGNGVVYEIVRKSERELWVTTNHGLCAFDTERGVIVSELLNDPSTETVYWVSFQDDKGRRWGRSGSGVRVYDPLNRQFRHFHIEKQMGKSFTAQDAIEAPGEGKLYVNTAGSKGMYLLDRATGSWTLIPPPPGFFKTHLDYVGRSLLRLQDGRLLVVEESTLFTLSGDGRSLVPFPQQPGGKGVRYMTALQDPKGRIWIGSVDGGLYLMDLQSGTTKNFREELLPHSEKGTSPRVGAIFKDRKGNIWIDIRDGMSIYDVEQNRFINLFHHPGMTHVFKHIGGFAEDLEGNVLIAGDGNDGIGIADPDHPERGIQRKLAVQGNPFIAANGMARDNSGNLWIDGQKKLLKLDLHTLKLSQFDGDDGLTHTVGDPETIAMDELCALASGEVFLSYPKGKGVGIFHPDSIRQNLELPRPYLTSFSVFNQPIERGTGLFYRREITLPFSQNFFSFEYSALGFSHPHQIRFMYKLEGIDPDWVYTDAGKRYASYTGIREGNYLLRIRAASSDGVWNEEEFNLRIVILPPWYRTWWAYIVYAAFLGAAALFVYKILKNRWLLEMKVQLEHAEAERLKELDAVKTRLYTNISHEFRTPLTVIGGMAEEVKLEIGKLEIGKSGNAPISNFPISQFLISSLDMIKRNSTYLLRLVNQMLDLRKLESGNMAVDMQNGDVLPFLRYLLESFHSIASAKNVEFRFETDLDVLELDYDPDKLQKIVSNLLSNALKFTPEGGQVELKLEIGNWEIGKFEEPSISQFLISISDTGMGIHPEKLPFIFDPFYQANGSLTGPGEGTGIGLALTRELVKLLGGTISVESEIGKGAIFTVRLPLTNQAGKRLTNDGLAVVSEAADGHYSISNGTTHVEQDSSLEKATTVLLIEDNADVVTYLKTCLRGSYQVLVATDGKAGMERAIEAIPDLILSDVMMPEMDGFEVCKALKNDDRTSHIPIILLTAKADMESRLEGLDCGADAYLSKPFEPRELLLSIQNLLELRQRMQSHYLALGVERPEKAAESQQAGKRESAFVQKTRAIVEQHLDDAQFSTEELGRLLAMSRSQLHRKLTALTGLSPNHFIRIVKLEKARRFLAETDMGIAEIAYRTGFSDPGYFSRLFRQEYGITPKEWRDGKGLRCK